MGMKRVIDRDHVLELKRKGVTERAIADRLGCSMKSVARILREAAK